ISTFEPNKRHLYEVLIFCFKWKKTAAEILANKNLGLPLSRFSGYLEEKARYLKKTFPLYPINIFPMLNNPPVKLCRLLFSFFKAIGYLESRLLFLLLIPLVSFTAPEGKGGGTSTFDIVCGKLEMSGIRLAK
ncbi:hypothetical protein ALC56_07506, partial [Trachymyrmex septentrionalis]